MREQMLLLKDLQEKESLIVKLEKDQEAALAADEIRRLCEDVHVLQTNIDKRVKDCAKLSLQYKHAEALLASLQKQKEHAEKNLYGGTVSSNKEMMQMQEKIQQLQEQIDKQENSMMEIIETQDTVEQKIPELNEKLTQMQHDLKTKRRENTEHVLRITTQVKDLIVAKDNLREQISKDILVLYDKLKRKSGKAVARLQGDLCTGCRVAVPSYVISRVQEAKTLVCCETCGRLLIPAEPA